MSITYLCLSTVDVLECKKLLFFFLYFRLRGIIECKSGHFKAFCRRGQDNWALYDDNVPKATRFLASKEIVPDAAIFTRID